MRGNRNIIARQCLHTPVSVVKSFERIAMRTLKRAKLNMVCGSSRSVGSVQSDVIIWNMKTRISCGNVLMRLERFLVLFTGIELSQLVVGVLGGRLHL